MLLSFLRYDKVVRMLDERGGKEKMMPYIIERSDNGVLIFTINRSEKRNAINFEVMDGLQEALHLAMDDQIKAFFITGAGDRAFCSGGDLSVFHRLRTEDEAYEMLSKMSHILYQLVTLQKPTIALLNGAAVGGGCEIAIACDYRLAKEGIKAGFVQGNLAITSGWGGGTILSEKLPRQSAMTMLMEAEIYSTEKLLQLGFIDDTYTTNGVQAGLDFIAPFLNKQTDVLTAYKQIFVRKWQQGQLKERIEEEVRKCAVLWEKDAHHEAVDQFMKK